LADGGYVEYEQALDFAQYLANENDYIAWSTASSKFLKLLPLMKTRGAYADFKVLNPESDFLKSFFLINFF